MLLRSYEPVNFSSYELSHCPLPICHAQVNLLNPCEQVRTVEFFKKTSTFENEIVVNRDGVSLPHSLGSTK